MNTPNRLRPAEVLILLTQIGLRRIGALIALVLVVLWVWAAFTGDVPGDRFKVRGKFGSFTTTTYSHSYPR
ncbi:hypothetical protein LRS13_24925 [Svornostia abyssi]|uniref:Uncharacterized protein n=1 Tax=Svornostia abyssi TaxID=2898438 RepID=A0ABY5PGY5_9ACTN|nr:hypothetical protein LRS13_24925 [Parviterribacteraceae bacterium J379]